VVAGYLVEVEAPSIFEQLASIASLVHLALGCFSFGCVGLEGAAAITIDKEHLHDEGKNYSTYLTKPRA
jgi:hypothetical protein